MASAEVHRNSATSILQEFSVKGKEQNLILQSANSKKSLQILKNGKVFARGGRGAWARYWVNVVDAESGLIRLQNVKVAKHVLKINKQNQVSGLGNLNGDKTVFQLRLVGNDLLTLQHVVTEQYLGFNVEGKPVVSSEITDYFSFFIVANNEKLSTKAAGPKVNPPAASLSESQLREFYTNGYVVVKGLIKQDILCAAIKHINQALGRGNILPQNDTPLFEKQAPEITNLVLQSKVYNSVQSLFGKRELKHPNGAQIALRFPLPGDGNNKPLEPRRWHIDGMDKEKAGNFSLLCGIALSNWPTPYMGNFTVFPQSHHVIGPSLQEMGAERFCKQQKEGDKLQFQGGVQVIAECGDVIMCHPFLAHRVGPNHSPHIRYAVFFRLHINGHDPHACVKDMWAEFDGVKHIFAAC